MRINFTSLPQLALPIYSTSKQKIVLAITALALVCFAAYYLVRRFCFEATKVTTIDPLDELKRFFKVTPVPPPSDKVIGKPEKGINIEARCSNETCSSNNKMMIFPIDEMILGLLAATIRCPCCQTKIKLKKVESFILDSCHFKVIGVLSKKGGRIENVFEALPGTSLSLKSDKMWSYLEFKVVKP